MSIKEINTFEDFQDIIKDINSGIIGINGWEYFYTKKCPDVLTALDNDLSDLDINKETFFKWCNDIEHIQSLTMIWEKDNFNFEKKLKELSN